MGFSRKILYPPSCLGCQFSEVATPWNFHLCFSYTLWKFHSFFYLYTPMKSYVFMCQPYGNSTIFNLRPPSVSEFCDLIPLLEISLSSTFFWKNPIAVRQSLNFIGNFKKNVKGNRMMNITFENEEQYTDYSGWPKYQNEVRRLKGLWFYSCCLFVGYFYYECQGCVCVIAITLENSRFLQEIAPRKIERKSTCMVGSVYVST